MVLGMIQTPLSRQELLSHPEGRAKIMQEADDMRAMTVWDEDEMDELDSIKRKARETGQTIHIADVMAIGHIKNSESAEKTKLKD